MIGLAAALAAMIGFYLAPALPVTLDADRRTGAEPRRRGRLRGQPAGTPMRIVAGVSAERQRRGDESRRLRQDRSWPRSGAFRNGSGSACQGLVTLPLDTLGTHAEFVREFPAPPDRLRVTPHGRTKAVRAAALAVDLCGGLGPHGPSGGRLRLHSDIPAGLGMGWSMRHHHDGASGRVELRHPALPRDDRRTRGPRRAGGRSADHRYVGVRQVPGGQGDRDIEAAAGVHSGGAGSAVVPDELERRATSGGTHSA